jgi:hypothetical protein
VEGRWFSAPPGALIWIARVCGHRRFSAPDRALAFSFGMMEWPLSWPTKDAAENSRRDIVRWWDAGRLRFNLYFGAVVVVTWLLVMIAGSTAGETGRGLSRATRDDLRPVRIRLLGEHLLQLGWISDASAFEGAASWPL